MGGGGGLTGGSGGPASGGGGSGAGGSGGTAGTAGGPNVVPVCLTMDVQAGVDRATNDYIECDVEEQAIDFDVAENYEPPRQPGYDPALTTVSFTDFGTAFTGHAVQECHPYCYRANLTLGVDFLAASEGSLRGEVLFALPDTVAPIANAVGRNSLGWIYLDGPALPAGTTLKARLVLKSASNGLLVASTDLDVTPQAWLEFKYFPIEAGFASGDLVGIEAIGFRIELSPGPIAADWHGVIYADHFQLRQ